MKISINWIITNLSIFIIPIVRAEYIYSGNIINDIERPVVGEKAALEEIDAESQPVSTPTDAYGVFSFGLKTIAVEDNTTPFEICGNFPNPFIPLAKIFCCLGYPFCFDPGDKALKQMNVPVNDVPFDNVLSTAGWFSFQVKLS
ncbi:hypothetical protein LLG96_14955 [bacterium]|nr:hypothetical protein [bacterium]